MVLDKEKYPEFVPWCLTGKIHSKHDKGDKIAIMGPSGGDMAMTADLSKNLAINYSSIPKQIVKNLKKSKNKHNTLN